MALTFGAPGSCSGGGAPRPSSRGSRWPARSSRWCRCSPPPWATSRPRPLRARAAAGGVAGLRRGLRRMLLTGLAAAATVGGAAVTIGPWVVRNVVGAEYEPSRRCSRPSLPRPHRCLLARSYAGRAHRPRGPRPAGGRVRSGARRPHSGRSRWPGPTATSAGHGASPRVWVSRCWCWRSPPRLTSRGGAARRRGRRPPTEDRCPPDGAPAGGLRGHVRPILPDSLEPVGCGTPGSSPAVCAPRRGASHETLGRPRPARPRPPAPASSRPAGRPPRRRGPGVATAPAPGRPWSTPTPKGGLAGMLAAWAAQVPARRLRCTAWPTTPGQGDGGPWWRRSGSRTRLADRVLCVSPSLHRMRC